MINVRSNSYSLDPRIEDLRRKISNLEKQLEARENEWRLFTKALREFERVAGECSGGSLTFDLHLNSELGLEKDYFENMSQGIAVDYAIVSPSHMSTFPQKATTGTR